MLNIFMYYTPSQFLSCSIRVENSADPDQMVHQKPADLDPQCFQKKKINPSSTGQGLSICLPHKTENIHIVFTQKFLYFMHTSSDGSCKTEQMCRLVSAFAGCIWGKNSHS